MKKELKDGLKKTTKITVIAFVSIAIAGLFVFFFDFLSNYFWGKETSPKGELLKVVLTFVAGIVGILVWYTGHRRVKEMQKQTEKTDKQIQIIFKGNVDTRFNNAVGHLSSENATVVLGGIHALHQIAIESKENYSQVVHNLFCSYLRENSAKLYKNIVKEPDKCPVIIQTLIDYLFKPFYEKESIYKNYKSDLSFSTFINCNFQDLSIIGVNFTNCDIRKCSFSGAKLNDVTFEVAKLNNVMFADTTLSDVRFSAELSDVHFSHASLCDVIFLRAKLSDVGFVDATLSNVSFGSATISDVNFLRAKLSKVDFWLAILEGKNNFKGTHLEGYSYEKITCPLFSEKTKSEKVE